MEKSLMARSKRTKASIKLQIRNICFLTGNLIIGTGYKDHVQMMAPAVQELASLERQAQILFLNSHKLKAK
jgi:hypothetical protein